MRIFTIRRYTNRHHCTVQTRELHGDGDDSTTAVMGLNFITDTAVIAGWEQHSR